MFAQFALFLLIGVMLFTYYQQVPLPVARSRADEILPRLRRQRPASGLAGFIVAAIVAAALSPSINAMAATTVNDFYLPYISPDGRSERIMRVSRSATLGWGIVQLAVALGARVHGRRRARCRPDGAVAVAPGRCSAPS